MDYICVCLEIDKFVRIQSSATGPLSATMLVGIPPENV